MNMFLNWMMIAPKRVQIIAVTVLLLLVVLMLAVPGIALAGHVGSGSYCPGC